MTRPRERRSRGRRTSPAASRPRRRAAARRTRGPDRSGETRDRRHVDRCRSPRCRGRRRRARRSASWPPGGAATVSRSGRAWCRPGVVPGGPESTATAINPAEHMKCSITTHGLSSVRTVAMPIRACAGMPSSSTEAGTSRSRRGWSERVVRQTASSIAAAIAPSTNVSSRLPNSMTPWIPNSGGRDQRLVSASRNRRTPQAGARQPDRAAGDDDADLGDERR